MRDIFLMLSSHHIPILPEFRKAKGILRMQRHVKCSKWSGRYKSCLFTISLDFGSSIISIQPGEEIQKHGECNAPPPSQATIALLRIRYGSISFLSGSVPYLSLNKKSPHKATKRTPNNLSSPSLFCHSLGHSLWRTPHQ